MKYTRARSSARARHEPRFQAQARAREMYEPLELGSARLRFKKTKIIIKMTQFFQNIKLVNIQTIKMATTIKSSMS